MGTRDPRLEPVSAVLRRVAQGDSVTEPFPPDEPHGPEVSMEILPIDLTAIVSIVMGVSVVLIPVAGLTARFALKPLVESLAKVNEVRGVEETVAITERRVALLEQQLEVMESSVRSLEEGREFDRALQSGNDGA
jgi:hypothetical protein